MVDPNRASLVDPNHLQSIMQRDSNVLLPENQAAKEADEITLSKSALTFLDFEIFTRPKA